MINISGVEREHGNVDVPFSVLEIEILKRLTHISKRPYSRYCHQIEYIVKHVRDHYTSFLRP